MKRIRLWSLFCILLLALGLTGCGADLNTFTWRVDAVPVNLDPQLAVSSEDVTAVMHLFRGLMRLDASGEPQPDAAESWTVSEDGKVYTFTLKEDLEWVWYRQRNQDYLRAVTAEDYVYGFQRVFDPETGSPYADDFSCIAGSEAVREGRADPSTLGVEAVDERTVRITLETADPEFLTKLCLPGAMPCNREFFDSTEGSYGLSSSSVMGNGPFYLYNWTSEGLFLRRSTSGSAINNLRLVLRDPEDTTSPADRVRDGSSGAELSDTAAEDLAQIAYTSRTWGLLFNCSGEDNPLANVSVRQALASAATDADLTLPSGCEPAQGLIPPSVNYAGESYRTAVGSALFTASDPVALYQQGMAELGQTTLRSISILAPEGSDYTQLVGAINARWQQLFACFFTVRQLPQEEYQAALASGDYQIALASLEPSSSALLDLPARFDGELAGFFDSGVHAMLTSLQAEPERVNAQTVLALEKAILNAAPFAPLYCQQQYLLVDPTVQGLGFSPFGPTVDLTAATRP